MGKWLECPKCGKNTFRIVVRSSDKGAVLVGLVCRNRKCVASLPLEAQETADSRQPTAPLSPPEGFGYHRTGHLVPGNFENES